MHLVGVSKDAAKPPRTQPMPPTLVRVASCSSPDICEISTLQGSPGARSLTRLCFSWRSNSGDRGANLADERGAVSAQVPRVPQCEAKGKHHDLLSLLRIQKVSKPKTSLPCANLWFTKEL